MFCIQRGNNSREQLAILTGGRKLGISVTSDVQCDEDEIPIGDVLFCESVFGLQNPVKDFFPLFIRDAGHLRRRVTLEWDPVLTDTPMFYKCATEWKSDVPSGVYQATDEMKKLTGLYFVSEVVQFVQEWRYYISEGEYVTSGWYMGENEDEPAPVLRVTFPSNFSGAVDFGRLDNGDIQLVEAHAPFACGWYGDNHADYALWQYMAWNSRSWWLQQPERAS